ncbi:hypothetical protein [Streptomyces sp. NPDC059411]|uniref:hypothetical protein n=1 Tax=Streptomyces sp. NPDC059411 TaxID=3346825 RepID=UPI0036924B4A
MFLSTVRRGAAAVLVATAAFATVSCSADPSPAPGINASATPAASSAPASAPASSPSSAPSPPASPPASPSSRGAASTAPSALPAEKVRDAFAGLQATLGDSCTPGNCAYFLGRVYDELHRMDRAMKADPKGPGHFPEPIALIAKLDTELGGDHGFDNLKKHQTSLIGTRDKINVWMQGHPDDYR